MIHFIRLTRPLNLIIIVLTMYGLGWYYDEMVNETGHFGIKSFDFFLLVLSTTMIAAAGNIINDYFDVRADRINKPDRLIIGKTVKRRVAIVTHWGLNFVAFSIAAYLSWRLETFWYVFIHLLSINMLWYYSSYFKRKFVIGNIMIAALTAMVPMLVGFYYFHYSRLIPGAIEAEYVFPFDLFEHQSLLVFLSIALAGFAFILNFAREIVKDMEDVEGDKILKAKTLPIVLGYGTSKWIIVLILCAALFMSTLLAWLIPIMEVRAFFPVYLSAFLIVLALVFLFAAKKKTDYKRVNTWIKLSMVAGLLSPIYWKLILIYG